MDLKETKEKKESKKVAKTNSGTTKKKVEKEENVKKVNETKDEVNEEKEKKNIKKASSKTKEKTDTKKEPKKTTTRKRSTTPKKEVSKKDTNLEEKKFNNIETDAEVPIEEEVSVKKDVTEEVEVKEADPVDKLKHMKEKNTILEENISKLKNKKNNKDETKDSDLNNNLEENGEIIIDGPKSSEKQKRKEKLEEESEIVEKKKKRKSIIITTSIIIALIVIIIIVIWIIGNLNSTNIESHEFYQWYSGQKVEYKGELTFTRKEGLTELKATDRKVTLDSTPVYYADKEGKVIFPEDMAIVFPNNNGMMYRINHFANMQEKNGEIYLETSSATKEDKTKLEKAFLYDGQDLYFFLDRTTITVNGVNYEVAPLSYAIVRYKQSVEIYNYDKDEYQIIDTSETQDAKIVMDTYTVNMGVDSLQTKEKEQLLIKGLSYLQPYGEKNEE